MKRTIRRRRLEAKTDYKARLTLLKSGKPRLVVRRTNKYIIAQIVTTDIAQDKVIKSVISKDLIAKGWPESKKGSLKSKAAAYLTGYLLGKEVKSKVPKAIFDIGMYRNLEKSRLYAVLKGALDAGLDIPHNPNVLITDEEISKLENKELITKLKK
ncbi:50S ribosomal protein L18 [Candidatus Pacearchaeota archaeon CG10_big_fil_rev_8_21_14_0_10_31_24]|nr:MAG: 50S ribosomal protein L18 [Candidatus Pacearchaeota archaeon CG10_big_fil_rev_8_21_14_0_10_31_24]